MTISDSTICHSTLTSSTTVVTAAHCMTRSQFEVKTMLMLMLMLMLNIMTMIQVVVGAHELQSADWGQRVNVCFIFFVVSLPV